MITEALKQVYTNCLQNCLFDCFGILVTPFTNDDKTVPLALDHECVKCDEDDKYRLMVPDESKRSLAYFEQSGDSDITISEHVRDMRHVVTPVNLVIWYNIKNIGHTQNSIKDLVIGEMFKRIDGCLCHAHDHPYLRNIRLDISGVLQSDPFEKYNYDYKGLGVYPNEWVHLSCSLQFDLFTKCVPDLECLESTC